MLVGNEEWLLSSVSQVLERSNNLDLQKGRMVSDEHLLPALLEELLQALPSALYTAFQLPDPHLIVCIAPVIIPEEPPAPEPVEDPV